ncbi:MAG: GPR endopeptidase [Ruminococcaceae bacterium]|nr:GPR endopeptidase [Oscillospiraceae bacterium]
MFFTNRTDLMLELAENTGLAGDIHTKYDLKGVCVTKTVIGKKEGLLINKPCGVYYTVTSPIIPDSKREVNAIATVLSEVINSQYKKRPRFLVAGLGNPDISADSLGFRVAEKVLATSSFLKESENKNIFGDVSVIKTDVCANSGIDSSLQIKLVSKGIGADIVIAVDSLACSSFDRLFSTVQITDSGIHPGSGAGNPRKALDYKELSVPVIAIGVPTVLEQLYNGRRHIVTRHDTDLCVKRFSFIISRALNKALNPKISEEELTELIDFS